MLEALRALGVLSEGLWKNLDGNDSPEPRIDRPIHLAHPACTERQLKFHMALVLCQR